MPVCFVSPEAFFLVFFVKPAVVPELCREAVMKSTPLTYGGFLNVTHLFSLLHNSMKQCAYMLLTFDCKPGKHKYRLRFPGE